MFVFFFNYLIIIITTYVSKYGYVGHMTVVILNSLKQF